MKQSISAWNEVYKNGKHLSIWPWSDIVSNFYKLFPLEEILNRQLPLKVLELGCGAGANIPLFNNEMIHYTGVDISSHIVDKLKTNYPNCSFRIGDFTQKLDFKENTFDLIIDRASLTHNNYESIVKCLIQCRHVLKKKGYFLGVDWFSKEHQEFKKGSPIDENTRVFKGDNYFSNLGPVHFSDEKDILKLFSKFEIVEITHKKHISQGEKIKIEKFASYNIIARKND